MVAGLLEAEVLAQAARGQRTSGSPVNCETITIAVRPASEHGKVRMSPLKRLRDVL